MEAVDDGALLVKERPVAWRPTNNCVQCSFIWVALSTHDLVFTIGVLCVVHVGSHLLQNPTPNFSSPSPSFITLAPLIHVTIHSHYFSAAQARRLPYHFPGML